MLAKPRTPRTPRAGKAKDPPKHKPETKLHVIERLISRKNGASETDLTGATGWLPHSLTGGISRLRTDGVTITKEKDPKRGTVFHGTRSKPEANGDSAAA